MTTFSITPVTGYPLPPSDTFPEFIQFQDEGANLGANDADTVNFTGAGVTATRGTGENSNVVTVDVAGGGGGGATPTLVLSLLGNTEGAFDNSDFSDWGATVILASTDAEWNGTNIDLLNDGVYEVDIEGKVEIQNLSGVWSTSWAAYGASVPEAASLDRSAYVRTFDGSGPALSKNYVQFHSTFIVNGATATPALYAQSSTNTEGALFSAVVTVRRLTTTP